MKKTTLLFSLFFVLFGAVVQSQNTRPTSMEDVENIFEDYFKRYAATTPVSFTRAEYSDQSQLNEKERARIRTNKVRTILRLRFFTENPRYRRFYKPFADPQNDCADASLEGDLSNFGFAKHAYADSPGIPEQFVNCLMTVNQDIPLAPGALDDDTAEVAPVSVGDDPYLASFGISLPRVNSGTRAVRMNVSEGGTDIVTMTQLTTITSDDYVFNFASVLQNPGGHVNDQPFFQVKFFDMSDNLLRETCIISDANNPIFINDASSGASALYTEWSCYSIDTHDFNGQDVRIEYSIADCGLSGHFGYVYIDDLCETDCLDGSFGGIELNQINGECPEFPIEVCGTYPGSSQSGYQGMALFVIDDGGTETQINTMPDLIGNQFCFTVEETDLPIPDQNYELKVVATYSGPSGITTYEDISSNEGPDFDFSNCCIDDTLPINFGSEPSTWLRRISNLVINSKGDIYVYFDRLREDSDQLTSLIPGDFTRGTFIMKFPREDCQPSFIELSDNYNAYGDLHIDADDNLYATMLLESRFVKLDSDLNIIYDHQLSTTFRGNINMEDRGFPTPTSPTSLAYAYGNSNARFNGDLLVTGLPSPKGPIVGMVNTTTGQPFQPYVFDFDAPTASHGNVVSSGIEVTNNHVFMSLSRYHTTAGSFTFAGNTYTYGVGLLNFIAKFNIAGNVLVPETLKYTAETYTHLEYNEQFGFLYAGSDNQIDAYENNLAPVGITASLTGTRLNDMTYNAEAGTLTAATFSNAGSQTHVREYSVGLGAPTNTADENLSGTNAGIYMPAISSFGDEVFLVGIYKSSFALNNGLAPSVAYDFYLEKVRYKRKLRPVGPRSATSNQLETAKAFSLYPNPSDGIVHIHAVTPSANSSIKVVVRDFSGNAVFTKEAVSVLQDATMELYDLKTGIYFVELMGANGHIEIHRLIIK